MRAIGELERKIINTICSSEPTSIAQLLCDNIPDLHLKIDNTANTPFGSEFPVEVKLVLPNNEALKQTAFEQTKQILYILSFLKYLEDEGYMLSGYFAHGRIALGYFSNIPNFDAELNSGKIQYTNYSFPDERIRQFIFEYADRLIIPTYHLAAFQKRGYRTEEEKRHRQVMWVAWVAIVVSFLLGILPYFKKCLNYDSCD